MLGCLATNIEIGVISLFAVVPFRYQIRHADSGLMEMRCDTYEHKGVLLQAD